MTGGTFTHVPPLATPLTVLIRLSVILSMSSHSNQLLLINVHVAQIYGLVI